MAFVLFFAGAVILWVSALVTLYREKKTAQNRQKAYRQLLSLQGIYLKIERELNQRLEHYIEFLEMKVAALEEKRPRHGRDGKFTKKHGD